MEGYIKASEASKNFKVTTVTLSNWAKQGKIRFIKTATGRHFYNKQDIQSYYNMPLPEDEKGEKVCYCRVSSRKQLDDLARQKEHLATKYPDHTIIEDVGSGINWKRKGLRRILELSEKGNLSEVVVAHRDRLSRIAFDLIEFILSERGCRVIVESEKEFKSREKELSEDLLSIITIYACREMGRRRYEVNKGKVKVEPRAEEDN